MSAAAAVALLLLLLTSLLLLSLVLLSLLSLLMLLLSLLPLEGSGFASACCFAAHVLAFASAASCSLCRPATGAGHPTTPAATASSGRPSLPTSTATGREHSTAPERHMSPESCVAVRLCWNSNLSRKGQCLNTHT